MKMLWMAVALFGGCVISGCGGGGISSSKPPSVSAWAGTYSGTLNFKGCPSSTSCGGDVITLTISDPADSSHPGEFLATITASGQDSTISKSFSGNGRVLYAGAAPTGPGTMSTNGAMYLSNGLSYNFFMSGSGSSTSSSPVLIDKIDAYTLVLTNGTTPTKGSAYFGTLTRK